MTVKKIPAKRTPEKTKTIDKTSSGAVNKLKWLTIVIIIAIMVAGNMFYADTSLALRSVVFIVVAVLLLLFAKTTSQGAIGWQFLLDARTEMRKVVWPTRQETTNTTMIIIAVVLLTALILWLFDSVFVILIKSLLQ